MQKTQDSVKISRAVLVFAKTAAWLCTVFLFLSVIGDPPPDLTPTEKAERSYHFVMAFYYFWGSWLVVIVASLWHRCVWAVWLRENADVWLAAYGIDAGTTIVQAKPWAAPFVRRKEPVNAARKENR